MPIACLDGDNFAVVTARRDLGYGHGKSGNRWALPAFGALCDRQIDLPYPYTLWHCPLPARLAVERILKERDRQLTVLRNPELEAELSRIASESVGIDKQCISSKVCCLGPLPESEENRACR